MLTVGFTLIGHGNWSGGETYLRNMLGVIETLLPTKVRAKVFLTPAQYKKVGAKFSAQTQSQIIVDPRVVGAGTGRRALGAVLSGKDAAFAALVLENDIDVIFETAQFFGHQFPIPIVSWIPDFQHQYLKSHFSKKAWWRRELGFRLQTGKQRTVMLSSYDALTDCEKFYPKSHGKTGVVRFAIDLDPQGPIERADDVRRTYDLPSKYFYLPNQYWSHKNHRVVIEALGLLARSGELNTLPPVILTGRTEDPRDPDLFKRDMQCVRELGCETHYVHLGLVPYADVFALNAGATAMLNPSLFEGWSTTVEEAKALGTPMILSDLNIHKEQVPDARTFPPNDAAALAQHMREMSASKTFTRAPLTALQTAQATRRQDYADALYERLSTAVAR